MNTIICLMGPTAAGKTVLAIELLKHLPCEIVSVDSAMVYRGMDIGTAKPSAEQLREAPHCLIDIRDPADTYSVGSFYADALAAIEAIHHSGRIPLLVGGTMMYFHSLQQGLSHLPPADKALRGYLDDQCQRLGLRAMYAQLEQLDRETAQRVAAQDWRRIQRALEVYSLTGSPLSQLLAKSRQKPLAYPVLNLAILPTERPILRAKIADRFLMMLEQGLIEEVEVLFRREDLRAETPALQAAGYKQIWQYLAGTITKTEMQHQAITLSCQLAKRQLTWLRHWENLHSFASDASLTLLPKILELLKRLC